MAIHLQARRNLRQAAVGIGQNDSIEVLHGREVQTRIHGAFKVLEFLTIEVNHIERSIVRERLDKDIHLILCLGNAVLGGDEQDMIRSADGIDNGLVGIVGTPAYGHLIGLEQHGVIVASALKAVHRFAIDIDSTQLNGVALLSLHDEAVEFGYVSIARHNLDIGLGCQRQRIQG